MSTRLTQSELENFKNPKIKTPQKSPIQKHIDFSLNKDSSFCVSSIDYGSPRTEWRLHSPPID